MDAAAPQTTTVRRVHWWHLVVPVLASVGAIVAIGFVGGLMAGGLNGPDAVSRTLSELMANPEARYVMLQIVMGAVYIALLVVLRVMLGPAGRTAMVADFLPVRGKWVAWGAASGIGLAIAVIVITVALNASGLVTFQENPSERAVMPHSLPQLSMAIATIVILGPYAEELYFRGALVAWIRDKIGLAAGIVIGAALFALAHGQFASFPGAQGWIATAMLMVIGLVNGFWAMNTGSLWPAFATHATFNGTMIALAMAAPDQ